MDLITVYLYNEISYGEEHADQYLEFLDAEMDDLAQSPTFGSTIEDFPGIRVFTAKNPRRKQVSGYRIFYREVEGGIEIIRVLHTSMFWPKHLPKP